MSFGSWLFCAQRFQGLFCGGVGFLIRLGEGVSLVRASISTFKGVGKGGGEGGSDGMRRSGKGAFITLDIGNSLLELIMLLKQASAVSRDEVVKAISEPCHTLAQVIEIARYAWEAGRY